jgi:membrane-bound lytic murein transglycosylase D
MKKTNKILRIMCITAISSLFIFASSKEIKKIWQNNYPTELDFCNEKVPVNIADVAERLDREMLVNMNMHASTAILIKRANKVFPIIEPILAKNGIPDDFKYLAVIESGLINAVSPAGAKGIWQFMPNSAKELNLEVTEQVDERYHLEKATQAACNYLNKAKNKFGNWTMAAASYNGGMAGLQKHIDYQKSNNYYDLWLTDETARYVFRIVALKEIMQNAKDYNFAIPNSEKYPLIPTKKLEIDSTITNLSSFALQQGINYKLLKVHNPWLRDKALINTAKKKYIIEIPENGY